MNNSLDRLFAGMADALRRNVIPHVTDEFARGQAFGIIFMLNCIAKRAAWSDAYVGEQLEALRELQRALRAIKGLPADAPRLPALEPHAHDPTALRDAADAQLCNLVDWLAQPAIGAEVRESVRSAIDTYIHRQLKHEIATSAAPMFAEISRGAEEERPGS